MFVRFQGQVLPHPEIQSTGAASSGVGPAERRDVSVDGQRFHDAVPRGLGACASLSLANPGRGLGGALGPTSEGSNWGSFRPSLMQNL